MCEDVIYIAFGSAEEEGDNVAQQKIQRGMHSFLCANTLSVSKSLAIVTPRDNVFSAPKPTKPTIIAYIDAPHLGLAASAAYETRPIR